MGHPSAEISTGVSEITRVSQQNAASAQDLATATSHFRTVVSSDDGYADEE